MHIMVCFEREAHVHVHAVHVALFISQAAVTSAASSVWGESDTADVLAEEIALNNFVTLRYLSDFTGMQARCAGCMFMCMYTMYLYAL